MTELEKELYAFCSNGSARYGDEEMYGAIIAIAAKSSAYMLTDAAIESAGQNFQKQVDAAKKELRARLWQSRH